MTNNLYGRIKNILLPCLIFSVITGILSALVITVFKILVEIVIEGSAHVYSLAEADAIFIPITVVGAAIIGFSSGLCYMLIKKTKLPYALKTLFPISLAHILGSVIIKTVGLAGFYDMPLLQLMLWRLLNYVIIGAIEYVLIYFVMKSKAVTSRLDLLKRR